MLTTANNSLTGIKKMINIMKEDVKVQSIANIAVMKADCINEAEDHKEDILRVFNYKDIFITDFSPLMGYATGRGT